MTKQEILSKVRHGDYKLVGDMIGVSGDYARKLVLKDRAKRHPDAIRALRRIIEEREKRLAEAYGRLVPE